jgi:mannose-6-phosphate isomerase-like protein (cupin superfamily)
MATILKSVNREFREDPNKIDKFRLFSDTSKIKNGLKPKNLNFDLRLLNPGQFSSPYHSHRNAEEFFLVLSGSMTIRTTEGLDIITTGDMVFCEMGETGAHQFYNHGTEPCTYLDVRTFIGMDISLALSPPHFANSSPPLSIMHLSAWIQSGLSLRLST